jgi:hypothetical protein
LPKECQGRENRRPVGPINSQTGTATLTLVPLALPRLPLFAFRDLCAHPCSQARDIYDRPLLAIGWRVVVYTVRNRVEDVKPWMVRLEVWFRFFFFVSAQWGTWKILC